MQIAAGLEQFVILTRVTLGDLYSRRSMVSDPPADPTARKPTLSYRPRWLVFYGCFAGRGYRFGAGERVRQVGVARKCVGLYWVSGLV
jgi:hypothetical protein